MEVFARTSPVLERMPFISIQGNSYRYNVEGTLPSVAFRSVGNGYTASEGVINPASEPLVIVGGDSDFDVALQAMGVGGPDLRGAQDAMKAKSLALDWTKTFFDGDSAAVGHENEFDGLNKRLGGTGQEFDAGAGGATLTLDMVDELLDKVEGGADLLLMNATMRRKINKLARASSQAIETISDTFGRPILAYGGVPIGVIGKDAAGAEILAFDEDDGATHNDTTSIYAVKFGVDGLLGIQTRPLEARDLGELDTKPVLRTRVEWYSGVAVKHPRCVARLKKVNNA
jgi:hypothetical protein